ncbi:homocysteine S-methyltransferase family protein [Angelakisella massiliensis]|uniref:homocysteine S-methyltransferase family protein n=1 Tax=Angelakisella massiliensis TaxID=1871018 RepID=UPI0024B20362|nr:homocysteine S-methyltransferase family protein [Angelakisella massiliensis]
MDVNTLLSLDRPILLDGAMGTMLQQKGLPAGAPPESAALEHPQWLLDIHRAYREAGSDILYADTFGASEKKLARWGLTPELVIPAAVDLARQAAAGKALVALDLGPIGQLLEPAGTLSPLEAYEIFARQVRAGAAAGADLAVIETMTDLAEMRMALLAVKENSSLPVLCTMTFEENGRTFTGCSAAAMALTLTGMGADAIGLNCSLGPAQLAPILEEMARYTNLPLIAKPNAGLPDPLTGIYDVTPEEFAGQMSLLADRGIRFLGGCCGTSPATIAALRQAVSGKVSRRKVVEVPAAVCSATQVVPLDRVRVIGERINPTGKKKFKEALLREDMDYLLGQALEQTAAGADILDVNVGLPGIDEKEMMVRAVKALQGVTGAPLQIDSTKPEVLEAALRVYAGKAIVNSVSGEERSLSTVLPLVKKYGAAVVGLTLDEKGIPKTAAERFNIARRILDRAVSLGIPRQNVYIDCLTLTVSAEQDSAVETLEAVRRVRQELGLQTVLGVSNISFGLPARPLVNQAFLTMAMAAGLTLPILNPNLDAMMAAVRSFHLLTGKDRDAREFVAAYGGDTSPAPAASPSSPSSVTLEYAVEHGLKTEAAAAARTLLETEEPMTVVNTRLIPALDAAGSRFESGKIFLPQLIQSAGAAQAAFEVVKEKISTSSGSVSKGTVVLATVKNDIHDIGKNIVKVLLENYGYTVVDLGRDVPKEQVADAVERHHAPLVGLSALMTTTLGSMAETIALLRQRELPCKVMVGGAVLTADYAASIGADFYARDAKEGVDIARQVIG